jgi:hypothetical protein
VDDTCKFCGTVATANDEPNCSSINEAYLQTPARPYGCPWFDKESRKLHPRCSADSVQPAMSEGQYWTNQLNACWDRSMSDALKTAAKKALNYIENTEGELGMTLSCGDALRSALAACTEPQTAKWPREIRSFVNEVAGVWDAFEHGLRQEISNTNYACVREKLTAVETILAAPQSQAVSDEGGK